MDIILSHMRKYVNLNSDNICLKIFLGCDIIYKTISKEYGA